MGLAQKILPHYTYEDYTIWEGRWELIDGFPIPMSPSPVPKHQRIASAINRAISISLDNCKDCNVYEPTDYYVADDTILQPDVLVLCQEPTKKYIDFTPSLVVEILSPSTALRDRITKFEIYQSQGVPYYLIADPDAETIENYFLQEGKYELQAVDSQNKFSFLLGDDCKAEVNFAGVFK